VDPELRLAMHIVFKSGPDPKKGLGVFLLIFTKLCHFIETLEIFSSF
jgi:hypothetical protein